MPRAAVTGELLPSPEGPARTPMSAAVSKFIRQIVTDGTYEQEIIRIRKEGPDLASMYVGCDLRPVRHAPGRGRPDIAGHT